MVKYVIMETAQLMMDVIMIAQLTQFGLAQVWLAKNQIVLHYVVMTTNQQLRNVMMVTESMTMDAVTIAKSNNSTHA